MDQVTCKPMNILPAGNVKVNIEGQSYSVCTVIDEGREQKEGIYHLLSAYYAVGPMFKALHT